MANISTVNSPLTLIFKTNGKWVLNTELLNSELAQPLFEIEQQTFFVI